MGTIEIRELELFIDNDADLYRQKYTPIVKNLIKFKKKGTFNPVGAKKAFLYLVIDGAKKYTKENGGTWNTMFSIQDRLALATQYVKRFEEDYKDGEFNDLK